jgi:hypothetical protein
MAQGFSAQLVGVLDGTLKPDAKADGTVHGGRVRCFEFTLDLAAATTKLASGDTNVLVRIPRGQKFLFGMLNPSVGLGGTATIAIGNSTTAGKYRAAAIANTAEAREIFGLSAAMDDPVLTAFEDVLLTIAAAALPSVGIIEGFILTTGR